VRILPRAMATDLLNFRKSDIASSIVRLCSATAVQCSLGFIGLSFIDNRNLKLK
jgi:hypothetical protein